jgi:gamma-glutamylcysteine synthetase
MGLFENQPAGKTDAGAATPAGNDAQIRALLASYEDATVQAIEDAENAARAGDPTLQQTIMLSAIAYSNAALMLQNKLKGGF